MFNIINIFKRKKKQSVAKTGNMYHTSQNVCVCKMSIDEKLDGQR